jgi:hypothetical protein
LAFFFFLEGAVKKRIRGGRGLTLRQQKFVKHYTDSGPGRGNATKAAELAGYAGEAGSNQLAVAGHENLRNPKIRQVIDEALDEAGCTLTDCAKVLGEALQATKRKPFMNEGRIVYAAAEPDFRSRIQAATIAIRLRGQPTLSPSRNAPPVADDAGNESNVASHAATEHTEVARVLEAMGPADKVLLRAAAELDSKLVGLDSQTEKDASDPAGPSKN